MTRRLAQQSPSAAGPQSVIPGPPGAQLGVRVLESAAMRASEPPANASAVAPESVEPPVPRGPDTPVAESSLSEGLPAAGALEVEGGEFSPLSSALTG